MPYTDTRIIVPLSGSPNPTSQASVLRAFPGAEGMGALTRGAAITGQGTPTVYIVTNTNDSGAGSFRAACEASGPRYIVFNVSGNIDLATRVDVTNPYITIAGQTSPGGVAITGATVRFSTSEVIVRHTRFRRGSHGADDVESRGESLYLRNGFNIMIDHCSISWGTDETFQISSRSGHCYGVTVSDSIVSQGLNDPHPEPNHGFGLNFSDKFGPENSIPGPEATLLRNYFVMHRGRAPQLKGDILVDHVNNVSYHGNARSTPSIETGPNAPTTELLPRANLIGNYTQPATADLGTSNYTEGFYFSNGDKPADDPVPAGAENRVYVLDNRGPARPTGTEAQWLIKPSLGPELTISEEYRKTTPWVMADEGTVAGLPVTINTMDDNYALTVVAGAGATYPVTDSHDQEMKDAFDFTDYPNNMTGSLRGDVSYPGDFPALSGTAWVDSNNDGIPDTYDAAHGFTTNGVNDIDPFATVTSSDVTVDPKYVGYQWMEAYIHGLLD